MVAACASARRPEPRKTARATNDCSPWSPGGTRPISPTPNAPALALTDAVTRLSDRTDPVPDEIWNEAASHYDEQALAALVLWIAAVNVFNRVNVAIRQVPGKYPG